MYEQKAIKMAYTPKEAALLFGLSEGTLGNWRSQKIGPKFYKINSKKVLYFREDLERWARSYPVETRDSIQ